MRYGIAPVATAAVDCLRYWISLIRLDGLMQPAGYRPRRLLRCAAMSGAYILARIGFFPVAAEDGNPFLLDVGLMDCIGFDCDRALQSGAAGIELHLRLRELAGRQE
jgi:hypothetical protein